VICGAAIVVAVFCSRPSGTAKVSVKTPSGRQAVGNEVPGAGVPAGTPRLESPDAAMGVGKVASGVGVGVGVGEGLGLGDGEGVGTGEGLSPPQPASMAMAAKGRAARAIGERIMRLSLVSDPPPDNFGAALALVPNCAISNCLRLSPRLDFSGKFPNCLPP
jgi:hypothetical protein